VIHGGGWWHGRATVVGVGFVLALTLPGLVLMLLAVAAVDQVMLRWHGRDIVRWRRDSQVSSTGLRPAARRAVPGQGR
jgi:hypothetical protein